MKTFEHLLSFEELDRIFGELKDARIEWDFKHLEAQLEGEPPQVWELAKVYEFDRTMCQLGLFGDNPPSRLLAEFPAEFPHIPFLVVFQTRSLPTCDPMSLLLPEEKSCADETWVWGLVREELERPRAFRPLELNFSEQMAAVLGPETDAKPRTKPPLRKAKDDLRNLCQFRLFHLIKDRIPITPGMRNPDFQVFELHTLFLGPRYGGFGLPYYDSLRNLRKPVDAARREMERLLAESRPNN